MLIFVFLLFEPTSDFSPLPRRMAESWQKTEFLTFHVDLVLQKVPKICPFALGPIKECSSMLIMC